MLGRAAFGALILVLAASGCNSSVADPGSEANRQMGPEGQPEVMHGGIRASLSLNPFKVERMHSFTAQVSHEYSIGYSHVDQRIQMPRISERL